MQMKIRKLVRICGVKILFGEVILELESDKDRKFLGILQANNIIHIELKGKIQKEYYKRVRQLISSKLNGGHTIRAINSRALSLVRFSAEH